MFRRFFSKARADRAAHLRYLKGLEEIRRGDFTILNQLAREVHENIYRQAASNQPLSPERAQLLRVKLALLQELEDEKGNPRVNWSLALPLSAFWDRVCARFNPQSRAAGLARLFEQTGPGIGYLSSGWLAPIGIGITIAVATAALVTNPAYIAKAETTLAALTQSAPQASPAQAVPASRSSAQTVDGSGDAKAKGVSAAVILPNGAGRSGGAKLDPPLKLEPRKITIRRQYEIRGDHFSTSSEHTTTITCGSPTAEKLCSNYPDLPKSEAWNDGTMCWEITDDRGTASFCARSN